MITHVQLTIAKPWADIDFIGVLDDNGARLLSEVVGSARHLGCRRITLHVDGVEQSDARFETLVAELRRSCVRNKASLQVVPGGAWLTEGANA